MSAPAASASTPASPLAAWRDRAWQRPSWWLTAASLAAWWALVVVSIHPLVHHGHGSLAELPLGAAVAWWTAMVVAMMLPLTSADARWIAFRSLPSRRQFAVASFAAGFLAVWALAGAVALLATAPVQGEPPALAVALAVAAGWQVAPLRRRALRRCAAIRAPAIRGWRAPADCARAGAVVGGRCIATCWAVMLPMAILHSPVLMAATALVVASERRPGPNPDRRGGRPAEALALLAGAGVVALAG